MKPSVLGLPYWEAMHSTVLFAQILSLLGSGIVIASFFLINKRKMFNYEVLFVNIADFFWVFWHFVNHAQAAHDGQVTEDKDFCTVLGLFTHMGIGWELMWLCCIATHAFYLFWRLNSGEMSIWDPSLRLKRFVFCLCWAFPMIWWMAIGLSNNAYTNIGYYCSVDIGSIWKTWVLVDGPFLFTFLYITMCYAYVIYYLFKAKGNNRSYTSEIRKYIIYIIVTALWMHAYVITTIYIQITGKIPYKFWLYTLFMINSLGTFNFLAYGIAEKWFLVLRGKTMFMSSAEPSEQQKKDSSGHTQKLSRSNSSAMDLDSSTSKNETASGSGSDSKV